MGDDSFDVFLQQRSTSVQEYHASDHAAHGPGAFSCASHAPKPNSSDSFRCGVATYGLMSLSDAPMSIPPAYPIERVVGLNFENHTEACTDIATWLQRKLKTVERTISVVPEAALEEPYKFNQIMTSKRKIIDIVAYYRDCVCFFAEVISCGNRTKTLQKLGYDLIHHLQWLKNRDSDIQDCSGFYFHFAEGHMDHVTELHLVWDEGSFSYNVDPKCLSAQQVTARLKSICIQEKERIDRLCHVIPTNFIIPMRAAWCIEHFGISAHQVHSGESVVIMNDTVVFKTPVGGDESRTLELLFDKNIAAGGNLLQMSILPQRKLVSICEKKFFFEFKLCKPPLSKREASENLKQFAIKTAAAIEELHGIGFAHLDIRLENICFVNADAVLIDLDRCETLITQGNRVSLKYGNSNMYKYKEGWTVELLDWKQYGLMLYSILRRISKEDYHTGILQMTDPFLDKLYSHG